MPVLPIADQSAGWATVLSRRRYACERPFRLAKPPGGFGPIPSSAGAWVRDGMREAPGQVGTRVGTGGLGRTGHVRTGLVRTWLVRTGLVRTGHVGKGCKSRACKNRAGKERACEKRVCKNWACRNWACKEDVGFDPKADRRELRLPSIARQTALRSGGSPWGLTDDRRFQPSQERNGQLLDERGPGERLGLQLDRYSPQNAD